jgi:hypothetical protein
MQPAQPLNWNFQILCISVAFFFWLHGLRLRLYVLWRTDTDRGPGLGRDYPTTSRYTSRTGLLLEVHTKGEFVLSYILILSNDGASFTFKIAARLMV